MTHWHDTPEFNRVRDAQVAARISRDDDVGESVCEHLGTDYFMRRRGRGYFMCRSCCEKAVELELLLLDTPPRPADAARIL